MISETSPFVESRHPAWARVDLDLLAANYRAIAAFARCAVMPVLKADAYGHGAVHVARRLEREGAGFLAVAYLDEGIALRDAGVRARIVVFAGFGAGQLEVLRQYALTPVVSTHDMVRFLLDADSVAQGPLAVHLEVDTGMGRLGFTPEESITAAERLSASGRIEVEGLMTHLASADVDSETTEGQLDRFDEVVADLDGRRIRPRFKHAANSAGLAFLRATHTLVRPGLLLYGITPRPLAPAIETCPAMTVSARISFIKAVPTGTAISYGGRWRAPRPSRIATIPLGYADGVPRTNAMEREGRLMVGGRRVPVTGTVCMDMVMLDVTELPDVRAGDEVTLLGEALGAWDLAGWAGTNAWQVLTAIGSRVPRLYIENGRVAATSSRLPGADRAIEPPPPGAQGE
ncbi:MAG: alanine racemase [Vicinamibacteria bacterium]|nr:alanine racemase [Vicinamibacteria bacterium]